MIKGRRRAELAMAMAAGAQNGERHSKASKEADQHRSRIRTRMDPPAHPARARATCASRLLLSSSSTPTTPTAICAISTPSLIPGVHRLGPWLLLALPYIHLAFSLSTLHISYAALAAIHPTPRSFRDTAREGDE